MERSVVHNGFIAGPAVSDGMIGSGKATMEMFCTGVSRLSKMFVNIEKHCAQQVSKVSEWLSKMVYCRAAVSDGMIGSGNATLEMFCTGVSRLSKMFANIEKHCAQQVSKVSEWLSKRPYGGRTARALYHVVLNGYPITRSRVSVMDNGGCPECSRNCAIS